MLTFVAQYDILLVGNVEHFTISKGGAYMAIIPYVHVYNGDDLLFTLRASSVRWGLAGKLMVFFLLDDEICCFESHRADRLNIQFVLNGEVFSCDFTEKDFDVISDPRFDFCDFIASKYAV